MSDIFISYASVDRPHAERLARQFQARGWSVWWDREIPTGGTFDLAIEEAIEGSKCLVVLWSCSSIASDWVKNEAREGMRRGALIPVLIEDVRIPLEFRHKQAADLAGWEGDESTPAFQRLLRDLERFLERADGVRAESQPHITEPTEDPGAAPEAAASLATRRLLHWRWRVLSGFGVLLILGAVVYLRTEHQTAVDRAGELRRANRTFKDCTECPEMVVVRGGSFWMGSTDAEFGHQEHEGPPREVTVQPFAIGKYEVTFDDWEHCVSNGGCNGYQPDDIGWGRGQRPVIFVSWEAARTYVDWLSAFTGEAYRLPSEAEWEYAARAGTTTRFSWGDEIKPENANYRQEVGKTAEVGSYPPNAWGLHDVHGNVWEWVEDCWNESYEGAPSDGSVWTRGDCDRRVLRGGSWSFSPEFLRSATREKNYTSLPYDVNGFRVARTLSR